VHLTPALAYPRLNEETRSNWHADKARGRFDGSWGQRKVPKIIEAQRSPRDEWGLFWYYAHFCVDVTKAARTDAS
jgi:hypothetical protein